MKRKKIITRREFNLLSSSFNAINKHKQVATLAKQNKPSKPFFYGL
jgi:hypothetical protein